MSMNFTAKQAYAIATRTTNLTSNHPQLLSQSLENGLYHINIRAGFLDYEFYIDAMSGEILGLSTEPSPENEPVYVRMAA